MQKTAIQARRGYTLIEFVIIIVMIGIFSATVMTNISARAQHSVTTQADELRRNLAHAQVLAISQGKRLRLTVDGGGTGYSVVQCTNTACSGTSALTDPATGLNFSVTLANGVSLSVSALDFDSLGRPQIGGSLITSSHIFVLNGSGRSASVSVLPLTGFAQTTY